MQPCHARKLFTSQARDVLERIFIEVDARQSSIAPEARHRGDWHSFQSIARSRYFRI